MKDVLLWTVLLLLALLVLVRAREGRTDGFAEKEPGEPGELGLDTADKKVALPDDYKLQILDPNHFLASTRPGARNMYGIPHRTSQVVNMGLGIGGAHNIKYAYDDVVLGEIGKNTVASQKQYSSSLSLGASSMKFVDREIEANHM